MYFKKFETREDVHQAFRNMIELRKTWEAEVQKRNNGSHVKDVTLHTAGALRKTSQVK